MEVASLLRQIPKVDDILHELETLGLLKGLPRSLVINVIRNTLDEIRKEIKNGGLLYVEKANVLERVKESLKIKGSPSLKRVINATGVILHTNLGRAPLSEEAIRQLVEIGRYYSNLEYDLKEGKRGHRYKHVEELLIELTGCEAAFVVNNNAAAVLLVLNTLAEGKEVLVSRGELVEIGGSFRIPEVMVKSGALLKEVGTTNRTHLYDYERAISPNTAMILKVHTSNYRVIGFTAEVPIEDLAQLAKKHGLLIMEDLGSGLLVDLSEWGIKDEPTVHRALRAGVDLVTFSGDKLLGGPQAGLILGRKDLVEVIRKNPLSRALRVDKLTLSALEATLRAYLDPKKAVQEVPVLKMITTSLGEIRRKARRLKRLIQAQVPKVQVSFVRETSRIGGGSFPLLELPTVCIGIKAEGVKASTLERLLREGDPPVVARVSDEMLLFDPRTLFEEEVPLLVDALKKALSA